MQRIDDVRTMCNKRVTTLKRLVEKPPRPVQTVNPEPRNLASAVNIGQVKTNLQIQPPTQQKVIHIMFSDYFVAI